MPKLFSNKGFRTETLFFGVVFAFFAAHIITTLSNANMRKYRPCHASSHNHIVQNLALSLHTVLRLHFPVKLKTSAAQKHRVFSALLRISS